MRNLLEDLYYGNIKPYSQQPSPNSELQRLVSRAASHESRLRDQLNETEQQILNRLITARNEINNITALEYFILGFRLGVRLMAECMDDNDGDIKTGGA